MNGVMKTYVILGIVFIASLLLSKFAPVGPVGDIIKQWSSIPAFLAVVGALFQLAQARIAHARSLELLDLKNAFSMGATSHMANVAFDKHVEFFGEYAHELREALNTLIQNGPTEQALDHATNLYNIKRRWELWITAEIDRELEKFEDALRQIGASAHLLAV